jgi:beta-glucosidase
VDFGKGVTGLRAGVAATAASSVEVRLDSPTGRVVATVPVTATGGVYQWATATAPVSGATGKHDLYLVFKGALRLKDLAFTR